MDIKFYRANERPYGVFSSLYRAEISIGEKRYRSVEDAYQSRKPRDPDVRDWLLKAKKPALTAMAAHSLLSFDIAPGWSRFRYAWMYRCTTAKFEQHEDLRRTLLETFDARLVEAGTVDNDVNRRWGEVNGQGRNFLGRILMRVRAELSGRLCAPDAELDQKIAEGLALLKLIDQGLPVPPAAKSA